MTNLQPLLEEWLSAKQQETIAAKRRLEIERQLATAFDLPQEGSKTLSSDGFKVLVTQPVTRKIDVETWDKVKSKIPMSLHPVKSKIEADAVGIKYLQAERPDLWKHIAAAFETKPGKVGFKVERIDG